MAARSLGADRAELLARTNSNDVTGESGGYVVGYGAVAFVAGEGGRSEDDARVPEDACQELLRIARRSVERCTAGEAPKSPESEHPALAEPRGVFVTLTRDGHLRGCIGSLVAAAPLGVGVQQMAKKAALQDPRFRPVRPEEVENLHIEISVLTPLRPLEDVSKVEVGRHGLLIAQGGASGVLLPQVPVELGWDRRTFLEQVCRKAGLPASAYLEDDIRLWSFEAQVFGEE
jgi:AmmeMemoRadiSam system protein A